MIALGEVVENLDRFRVPVTRGDRKPGPYPYYGAAGVQDWVDGWLYEGRHLLVAEDGTVEGPDGGLVLQLPTGRFWVNNHAHVVKAASDGDTRFIYYALHTVAAQPYITGAVQQKISQANLNRIQVKWPDAATRARIASTLGALDDKIELNRRMSETLEEVVRTLFRHRFLAQERDRDGLPVDSFFEIVGGGTPRTSEPSYWGGEIPWFSVVDTPSPSELFVVKTEKAITPEGLASSSARLVEPWTTIISARGTVGSLAMAAQHMTFNQSCYALVAREPAGPCFVNQLARHMVDQLERLAHGSVFSTITRKTFAAIAFPKRTPLELEAFEAISRPVYERILRGVRESAVLRNLRDTLLPRLISGEARIPDAERLVSEVT